MFKISKSKITLIISMFIFVIPNVYAVHIHSDITHTVSIQPIIVSDYGNSEISTFLGSVEQQSSIEEFVDEIWGQAGVDVSFLGTNEWKNTNSSAEGVMNTNEGVINLFKVNIPAGFTPAGFAFIGASGISQFLDNNLLEFSEGREIIANVLAQEIGLQLGLSKTAAGIDNLLSPNGTGNTLTESQITAALASSFVVSAVPVPSALWLLGTGLVGLVTFSRKRVTY